MSKSCELFDEHDPTKYFADYILSGGGTKVSNATGFEFVYDFDVNELDGGIYYIDITRTSIFDIKKYNFILDINSRKLVISTPIIVAYNNIRENQRLYWLSRFFKKIFNYETPRYCAIEATKNQYNLYRNIFKKNLSN